MSYTEIEATTKTNIRILRFEYLLWRRKRFYNLNGRLVAVCVPQIELAFMDGLINVVIVKTL